MQNSNIHQMELSNPLIENLAKAKNSNAKAVEKVAYEIANRIDELEMESISEAVLMLAYLKEIGHQIVKEFNINGV